MRLPNPIKLLHDPCRAQASLRTVLSFRPSPWLLSGVSESRCLGPCDPSFARARARTLEACPNDLARIGCSRNPASLSWQRCVLLGSDALRKSDGCFRKRQETGEEQEEQEAEETNKQKLHQLLVGERTVKYASFGQLSSTKVVTRERNPACRRRQPSKQSNIQLL